MLLHRYEVNERAELLIEDSVRVPRLRPLHLAVQDPTARGIRYEIDGEGKVSIIHIGGPAIQLVEGCA